MICSFEGCNRPHSCKSLCKVHYNMWKKKGVLKSIKNITDQKYCSVEGCEKKYNSKGFCKNHYKRFLKHGTPHLKPKLHKETCTLDACINKHHEKGPSIKQYPQILGPTLKRRSKNKGPCIVPGCDGMAQCKEMCSKHYERVERHGDPNICYTRKYREKPLTMMRDDMRYKTNNDEKDCLRELFKEKIGMNEGENIYCFE